MTAISPRVFVSSTCFDLRQVRDDLRAFIEEDLGYVPLLSENPSFPVDADATTIENCQRRVRDDADILVLIIGARYGHVPPEGEHSVVNLEYVAAREAGIPVYAFVEARVLTLYETWQRNPEIDFSAEVDSPSLFDFIKRVRETDSTWVHRFDVAQDLVDSLRTQFSFRVREALLLLNKIERRSDRGLLETLPGDALRVAVERPDAWVARVFSIVLQHGVDALVRRREDYDDGIAIGPGELVPEGLEGTWVQAQMSAALRMIAGLNQFVDVRLARALGADDLGGAVRAAESLTHVYGEALDWSHRIRCVEVGEQWIPVLVELARSTLDPLNKIRSLGTTLVERIDAAIAETPEGETVRVDLTVTIEMHNSDQINALLQELILRGG